MSARSAPLAADAPAMASPAEAAGRTFFFVTAATDSGLLPRILQPFAKLGLVPYRVHASTEQGSGEEMSVELRIAGSDPANAERLASLCRGVIGVRSVIMAVESERKGASLS